MEELCQQGEVIKPDVVTMMCVEIEASSWHHHGQSGWVQCLVSISGWPRFGSVRLRFGDGTVRVVPVFGSGGSSKEGFLRVSVQFNREDGSGSGFGSWKTVLAVPVPRSVPGKTVPTVPVSGSDSVLGPPCNIF